ncbi:hypothetical protein C5167_001652 [Papaver somniferum]|uniref:Uncharacterized protein n=1 Tax=Papaver somniferum TaxID=3469 RepID=A0A4Y7KX57_PAPSO|nr:hypothetical protein C5167_001652 [Papaver somniferum]
MSLIPFLLHSILQSSYPAPAISLSFTHSSLSRIPPESRHQHQISFPVHPMALRAPFLNCSATAIICYTNLQLHIPIGHQPTIIPTQPSQHQLNSPPLPFSSQNHWNLFFLHLQLNSSILIQFSASPPVKPIVNTHQAADAIRPYLPCSCYCTCNILDLQSFFPLQFSATQHQSTSNLHSSHCTCNSELNCSQQSTIFLLHLQCNCNSLPWQLPPVPTQL